MDVNCNVTGWWRYIFLVVIIEVFSVFVSGDLSQLRPPLSASVEEESIQQHLVVSHCTCGVSNRDIFCSMCFSSL